MLIQHGSNYNSKNSSYRSYTAEKTKTISNNKSVKMVEQGIFNSEYVAGLTARTIMKFNLRDASFPLFVIFLHLHNYYST